MELKNEIINGIISSITNEEKIEIYNKSSKDTRYFNKKEEFYAFLDKKLTKLEIMEFFINSDIGYSCQEDKICVTIDEETGKPKWCFIPNCDYDESDWWYDIDNNVSEIITKKFNEKVVKELIDKVLA